MSVYMGLDWSSQKHDIVLLNEAGAIIACLTIPHQVAGSEIVLQPDLVQQFSFQN